MIFRSSMIVLSALLTGLALTSVAQTTESTTQDSGAATSYDPLGGQPGALAKLRDYVPMRVSSEDRTGNADMRRIEPGAKLELAKLEGPGEITHLWTTIATPDPDHLRNVVIRIFWDGNDYPSVESPIGDFYGLGHAKYYYFNNPVQAIGTNNGMNCFWPMPFAKSARIEVVNEGPKPIDAFYYYVDWRKLNSFPKDATYFHAQYRQAFPNIDGQRYVILDTDGAPGHYVGVSLSIHTMVGGWWGEGDDVIYLDGEERASMWGTGSEDYFCGAWCYGETFYNDYFGMPLRTRSDHNANNYWNVYRLHLENPIAFKKSIRVEIEHGANGFDNTRGGSNNNYSSVTYWYQASPRPLKGSLAPAANRISKFSPPQAGPGVYEVSSMIQPEAKGFSVDQQNMNDWKKEGREWLNNDHTFVHGIKDGNTLEFQFETTDTLSGATVLRVTKAPDYGQIKVELDGDVLLKNLNLYSDAVEPVSITVGERELKAGKHVLKVTVLGKDEKSKANGWGMDYIRVGGVAPKIEGVPSAPTAAGESQEPDSNSK